MPDNRGAQGLGIFQDLAEQAEKEAHTLQPWPNYYRLRAKEMEMLFSMYKPHSYQRVLDIGTGIGFNAFLLSRFYREIIATDLYAENLKTHSIGIEKTRCFLERMSCTGIEIVPCSCENLPLQSDYFDTVYMIYTLEHVKERELALKEVKRVLKPNGEAVIIVPAFLERLLYPFSFYRDFLKKVWTYFVHRNEKSDRKTKENYFFRTGDLKKKGSLIKQFMSSYPHFPFPEPHGEYPNYFVELVKSTHLAWIKLIKKSDLRIKQIFTTMLFPKEFSSFFLGEKALEFYIRTLWINKKLGEKSFFRFIGQNLCLILMK